MVGHIFECKWLGFTYTDFLLIGGEFREDMVSMGWADPNLREGCKFLRHLVQQSPHLQQKHHSQVVRLVKRESGGWCWVFPLRWQAEAHLSVVVLKVAQLETLLQFGLMSYPELIESPFCLIQLRQQSDRGVEKEMGSVRWTETEMDSINKAVE